MRRPSSPPAPTSRGLLVAAALAVLTGAAGCSDSVAGPSASALFPREMRLIAEAEGEVAGLQVSCFLDWNLDVEPSGSDLFGTAGGEAYRQVLDGTGAGIEFWADAFSETLLRVAPDGAVSLTAYQGGTPMPRVTDSRFWESVRVLRGEVAHTRGVYAEGDWDCPPMDARGDEVATVSGKWILTAR